MRKLSIDRPQQIDECTARTDQPHIQRKKERRKRQGLKGPSPSSSLDTAGRKGHLSRAGGRAVSAQSDERFCRAETITAQPSPASPSANSVVLGQEKEVVCPDRSRTNVPWPTAGSSPPPPKSRNRPTLSTRYRAFDQIKNLEESQSAKRLPNQ